MLFHRYWLLMNLKGKYIVIEAITTSQDNMNGKNNNIHIIQSSKYILHGIILHISYKARHSKIVKLIINMFICL